MSGLKLLLLLNLYNNIFASTSSSMLKINNNYHYHLIPTNTYRDKWTNHKGPFTNEDFKDFNNTKSGLLYKDINKGYGCLPNDGDGVTIQIVGYVFETGDLWVNTYKDIPTYKTTIRAGPKKNQIYLAGLSEGVQTMKKGCKRILVIPEKLVYNNKFDGIKLVCYIELENIISNIY